MKPTEVHIKGSAELKVKADVMKLRFSISVKDTSADETGRKFNKLANEIIEAFKVEENDRAEIEKLKIVKMKEGEKSSIFKKRVENCYLATGDVVIKTTFSVDKINDALKYSIDKAIEFDKEESKKRNSIAEAFITITYVTEVSPEAIEDAKNRGVTIAYNNGFIKVKNLADAMSGGKPTNIVLVSAGINTSALTPRMVENNVVRNTSWFTDDIIDDGGFEEYNDTPYYEELKEIDVAESTVESYIDMNFTIEMA